MSTIVKKKALALTTYSELELDDVFIIPPTKNDTSYLLIKKGDWSIGFKNGNFTPYIVEIPYYRQVIREGVATDYDFSILAKE